MHSTCSILLASFCVLAIGSAVSYAQVQPDPIDVIVGGIQYGSVLEYKREKIKKIVERALSAVNLQEFSEKEICDIFIEVRKEQTADISSQTAPESKDEQIIQSDALIVSPDQMQEMLDRYNDDHKQDNPLKFDPDKVKSVIVEPDGQLKIEPEN